SSYKTLIRVASCGIGRINARPRHDRKSTMRIVSAHVGTIPISSPMRNAYIDFSKMDCTIVALVSDVVVDGKPLVGYGFNSNGRYNATAIMNERMLPRLQEASAEELLDENGELSPAKAWDVMMRNEKPGGHGERSV